ncbi:Ribosome biogenesis protein erb1 [Serendipita sp. 399]|nr:Ribosome biogenesis protein erb1 [Serendipita sp. 399]
MAQPTTNGTTKKRKKSEIEIKKNGDMPLIGNLELESDGEDIGGSDDDEVEDFPELDLGDSGDSEDSEDLGESTDLEGQSAVPPQPGELVVSSITGRLKRVYPEIEPEYDSDSSTEDAPNRVGNIPMHWYDDMPHIGYDINGKKVLRPAKGDELDKFLNTVENPESWTSAYDKNMQMDKPLTTEELDIIRRLYTGENPDAGYDPYEPTVEWFTGKGKEEIMPLSAAPEPKRRFVPSKWENQKIMKIVRAIRQGRIVPNKPKTLDDRPQFYSLWETPGPDHPAPAPAPKPRLPTNAESYNPPEEYLPTEEEKKEWEDQDQEDRERDFLPQKHSALRLVPAYPEFIKNRFDRLLDLYLAPRIQRRRLNIDPDSLIPTLPSPQSLRPFPTYLSLYQRHHTSRTRCLSVSPNDEWVVSGDENGVISLWEVLTGHEAARWSFEKKVGSVTWCPRKDVSYFVVGLEEEIVFMSPPFTKGTVSSATKTLFDPEASSGNANGAAGSSSAASASTVSWTGTPRGTKSVSSSTQASAVITMSVLQSVRLPPVAGSGTGQSSVWIHQVSKQHSQAPFKNVKGTVQKTMFHPIKPHFFVATQRYVRVYDLAAQQLLKTYLTGIKWISSLDVHPSGDHFIVGGYDKKLCWFDLELSDKPYKVLRYHTRAIRALAFHPTFPLFVSCADDGSIQVFHARVYNDLMSDPLIVPLKILRGTTAASTAGSGVGGDTNHGRGVHEVVDGLGVLDVQWCHSRPWLVSAGADGTVAVWCP